MLTFGGDASTVLFERSNFKKWVKLVPIEKTVIFDNYENKEYFTPVANIVRDDDYIGECKKKYSNKI